LLHLEKYSASETTAAQRKTYDDFIDWYKDVFFPKLWRLKWNRFHIAKVGEIRDKKKLAPIAILSATTSRVSLPRVRA
jgi:hypothetical protein